MSCTEESFVNSLIFFCYQLQVRGILIQTCTKNTCGWKLVNQRWLSFWEDKWVKNPWSFKTNMWQKCLWLEDCQPEMCIDVTRWISFLQGSSSLGGSIFWKAPAGYQSGIDRFINSSLSRINMASQQQTVKQIVCKAYPDLLVVGHGLIWWWFILPGQQSQVIQVNKARQLSEWISSKNYPSNA